MEKKLSIEDIRQSVENLDMAEVQEPQGEKTAVAKEPQIEKTAVAFSKKKKKRKIRKYIILTIVALMVAGLGWLGWVSYNSIKNVFSLQGVPGLLGFFDKTQLKGEGSGRVNVLILGVGDKGHAGQDLSDTIMVLSVDTKNKKAAMISIPRDLYVKINGYGYAKINAAHSYGEQKKVSGGGPQLAKETVSEVLGIPIHYYARLDFTGFKKLVDTIGGVDIDVEKNLYDPFYPGSGGFVTVNIKKGRQHMDGTTALRYARSRETTSDFDRARRQQQVLVAIKEKVLSSQTLLNPAKLTSIIKVIGEHLKTDFQTNEFRRIIELSKQINTANIINKVIDNGASGLLISQSSYSTGYILIPRLGIGNYKEIQELAKDIFKQASVKSEAARIIVLNGTTRSGLATTASNQLKGLGYNVIQYGTATTSYQTTTLIKDYTNGAKPITVSSLQKLLNASVVKATGGSKYDIEIILGKNYK